MKSGNIKQFAHLSLFTSIDEFNKSMKQALALHGHHFTKSERIALNQLTQYSAKYYGVCNARICKLVQAPLPDKGGISRSTFERMLRKAKKLGIISTYQTIREKGGYSHNVYVFQNFNNEKKHPHLSSDGSNSQQLTERQSTENKGRTSPDADHPPAETRISKTTTNKKKDLRPEPVTEDSLDETFVPDHVPQPFVKAVKPFFDRAKDICTIWSRAAIAYRSMKFDSPIDSHLQTIIQAFKQTIYRYKQNRIKTSFIRYFYGTVAGMLAVEKRRIVAKSKQWFSWLSN